MSTKAYFMIKVKSESCSNGQVEEVKVAELWTIPEVSGVELIDGNCDLLVQVEAPVRVVFTANKVLALDWVKELHVLKVAPPYHSNNTRPHKFAVQKN